MRGARRTGVEQGWESLRDGEKVPVTILLDTRFHVHSPYAAKESHQSLDQKRLWRRNSREKVLHFSVKTPSVHGSETGILATFIEFWLIITFFSSLSMDLSDSQLDQEDEQTEKADCRIRWLAPSSDRLPCISEPELSPLATASQSAGSNKAPGLIIRKRVLMVRSLFLQAANPRQPAMGARCR